MRTPQCKAEKVGRECYPGPPRRSPRRASAGRSAGGALRKPPGRARGARQGGRRPRDATGPPSYGGRLRPSTYEATGTGRRALQGWRKATGEAGERPCKGCRAVQRLARAQPPPLAAVWKEGGAWRRPARHLCGVSEANGTGAAPSRAGGKGRPFRAAGCGRLPLGSRGHPCNFPGVEP